MRLFASLVFASMLAPLPALAQDRGDASEGSAEASSPSPEAGARETTVDREPAAPDRGAQPPDVVPIDLGAPAEPENVFTSWWLWTAVGLFVGGIVLAVVMELTTDDPASSPSGPGVASAPLLVDLGP